MDLSSLTSLYAFLGQHAVLFGLMGLSYFAWPSAVTNGFQWVESQINKLKFTVFGISVDMSQQQWADDLLNYLRDYIISLGPNILAIRQSVLSGGMDTVKGEEMISALVQEITNHFENDAPAYLRQYVTQLFGGDKVLALEFLARRVAAIMHDLGIGSISVPAAAPTAMLVEDKKKA